MATLWLDFDALDCGEDSAVEEGINPWTAVGDVEAELSRYTLKHRWAADLFEQLETATQTMEPEEVAQALDDISMALETDAPELAAMARTAMIGVRFSKMGLHTVL